MTNPNPLPPGSPDAPTFERVTLDMSRVTVQDVAMALPQPTPEQEQQLLSALATIHTMVQENADAATRVARVLGVIAGATQVLGRVLTLV